MYCGYGILRVQAFEPVNPVNDEAVKFRIIEAGELAMLCAEADEDSLLTARSMRHYSELLSHVTQQTTIIPLRFGTMFHDEGEIRLILKTKAKDYLRLLSRFTDKIEVELGVWWEKEAFSQMILKNKKIARWKKALERGAGEGYDVVEFGQAVEELADQERTKLLKAFLTELQPLSVKHVIKSIVNEHQAFNGVFLVDRKYEEKFDQAVGGLCDKYSPQLIFKYTGPWAPHHFIEEE